MTPYKIVKKEGSPVATVKVKAEGDNWEQWFLLSSDWHIDNPHCNHKRLFSDLDKAKERGAGIFCFGDLFCAMQGRNDKRRSGKGTRLADMGENYFDNLVTNYHKKLIPYSDNLVAIAQGNHETAVRRFNGTDLIERLAYRFQQENASPVVSLGYSGYIRFQFKLRKTVVQSFALKFHHGWGGNAVVTKGAVQQQRASSFFPGADIVYMGHNHQLQATVFPQEVLTSSNKVISREQVHLRGATYKDSWADGSGGWEVEKGFGPSPLGGWWLRFYIEKGQVRFSYVRE